MDPCFSIVTLFFLGFFLLLFLCELQLLLRQMVACFNDAFCTDLESMWSFSEAGCQAKLERASQPVNFYGREKIWILAFGIVI